MIELAVHWIGLDWVGRSFLKKKMRVDGVG